MRETLHSILRYEHKRGKCALSGTGQELKNNLFKSIVPVLCLMTLLINSCFLSRNLVGQAGSDHYVWDGYQASRSGSHIIFEARYTDPTPYDPFYLQGTILFVPPPHKHVRVEIVDGKATPSEFLPDKTKYQAWNNEREADIYESATAHSEDCNNRSSELGVSIDPIFVRLGRSKDLSFSHKVVGLKLEAPLEITRNGEFKLKADSPHSTYILIFPEDLKKTPAQRRTSKLKLALMPLSLASDVIVLPIFWAHVIIGTITTVRLA